MFKLENNLKYRVGENRGPDRQNNGWSNQLMNRVCPNLHVRHENITLWSSSWRLKFIHSQFPLSMPMALNSVLLKCQRLEICLFILSDRHVPICNRM